MTSDLQLVRWGLRFERPQTEGAYRAWHLIKAVPLSRLGLVASLFAWGLVLVAAALAAPALFWGVARWILFLAFPFLSACLAVTWIPRLRGWVLPTTMLANAMNGLVGVGLAFWVLDAPEIAMAAVVIVGYFAFTVFRLHPLQAGAAVGSYAALHGALLAQATLAGTVGLTSVVWYAFIPVIAASTGLLASLMIHRISRESYAQEQIIGAQRAEIELGRARADKLLHSILPVAIADRLKRAPGVIADRFDEVTVLFADLVGFTPLAAKLGPEELVALLNELFTRFDALAAHHGVEKIKTIGDAYMAVAGVPAAHPDHAVAAAELALSMRLEIESFSKRTQHAIKLRIGLCSGPVVAGVIGASKFAYDLWGDTVNTAARMESHSLDGQIQVAETTHRKLAGRYVFEGRGMIEIKGKGPMSTWLLIGRAEEAQRLRHESSLPATSAPNTTTVKTPV